jgi:hypothetical protein
MLLYLINKVLFYNFLSFLMSAKSCVAESIQLDIENLHQLMPKSPKAIVDEWIEWKTKTDS